MQAKPMLQTAGRNPFYLLSSLFMLLGCFALSHHLRPAAGQWIPLVVLIGVLQVYELIVLTMAVYLNRRDPSRGDAMTLFSLGLLFLVDATYLNAELAASSPWVAPWVALALLVLGALKLVVLREALGLRSRSALAVAIVELGVLLYLPGTVSAFHFLDSNVHALGLGPEVLPPVIYGLWWLVGCIPITFVWTGRETETRLPSSSSVRRVGQAILLLPLGSILVHFLTLHWLYSLPFQAGYITPLLLGASLYGSTTVWRKPGLWHIVFRWAVPVWAILFSLNGQPLGTVGWSGLELVVSPLRVALLGLTVVCLLHRLLSGEKVFGWAAAGSLVMALSGPAPGAMVDNWMSVAPRSALEVGVASIVAAFAFLALGFARSLLPNRAGPRGSTLSER